MQKTAICIEYLAGLFDGEGWISLKPFISKYGICVSLNVGIAGTHPTIKNLGKELGWPCSYKQENNKHKAVYRIQISGRNKIKEFLESVYPYLRIKKIQARVMLKYIANINTVSGKKRTQEQLKLVKSTYNKLRDLNARGARKIL